MKILVIGASSFTGKHFCRYAREKGAGVKEESFRDFEWRLSNITLNYDQYDYVVNFAALNMVAPSWENPGDYFRTNLIDTGALTHFLSLLKTIKKYVHVSTPEVYGSTQGWVTEDAPYNPSTPYAVSRAAAEMLLKCFHKQYGLPVVFTRACNVYGPGQQLYRLIPKLIVSIKKGIRFPLEGGGLSSRSFIHVRDVCDATWRVMLDGEVGTAYHISTPGDSSIRGVARLLCNIMEVDPHNVLEDAPERPGKDASYQLLCNRIHLLGWQARVLFIDGVKEVIEWIERDWDTLKDQSLEYTHRP